MRANLQRNPRPSTYVDAILWLSGSSVAIWALAFANRFTADWNMRYTYSRATCTGKPFSRATTATRLKWSYENGSMNGFNLKGLQYSDLPQLLVPG